MLKRSIKNFVIDKTIPKKNKKKQKKEKIIRTGTEKLALAFLVLGIIALVIAFLPLTSIFAVMIFGAMLVLFAALTMFTIFFNEKFRVLLSNSGEIIKDVQKYIIYTPYIFAAAGALFTFSLITYCFSKNQSRKVKGIIATIIFLILTVAGIAFTVTQF